MTADTRNDRPFTEQTRVALLGDEHWRTIRKQFRLSPRELQVAKLVCEGFSNDEIAAGLKMKVGTVKTHVRNIYRRIRVGSKLEMLLKFINNSIKNYAGQSAVVPPVPIMGLEKSKQPAATIDGLQK